MIIEQMNAVIIMSCYQQAIMMMKSIDRIWQLGNLNTFLWRSKIPHSNRTIPGPGEKYRRLASRNYCVNAVTVARQGL